MGNQSQEDSSEEHAFYGELDKKTARYSCCTLKSMAIFFAVLLAFSVGLVFYLVRALQNSETLPRIFSPRASSMKSFQEKLNLDNNQAQFELVITSEELTSIAALGIEGKNFTLKEIEFIIKEKGIEVRALALVPLKIPVKMETTPVIFEGKIKFKVAEVHAGKITLPGIIRDQAETALDGFLDKNFQPLYESYRIERVELKDDQMILKGAIR